MNRINLLLEKAKSPLSFLLISLISYSGLYAQYEEDTIGVSIEYFLENIDMSTVPSGLLYEASLPPIAKAYKKRIV